MLRGYLVSQGERGQERRVPIGPSITLGRAVDCGFIIDDAAASRRHLRIATEGERFVWKDLGSTNGTQLNGQPMLEGVLKNGDRLQVGETVMRFEIEDITDEEPKESTTIFKETIVDWQQEGLGEQIGEKEERAERLLRAVYAVMNEIASNYEPCPLVDRILETTMKAIDAQRGSVVFAGEDKSTIEPCPVCHKFHVIQQGRLTHVEEREFHISNTVAHRVLKRGESLLFQDTDRDSELNVSASIMSLRLRSIICVPLRGKFGIFGLLYIDSDRAGHQYTHEDMLLTTAVGNSAGLALENATMHGQILEKQRIDQEIQHAWKIQEGFLVRQWPEGDGRFQVYGETRPAKTVGGDFYDFVQPDANHVGILIGDVSGKGVPAALTMAQLLAEFRQGIHRTSSPSAVLQILNESLVQRSPKGTFCTLCYLVLNVSDGHVVCANAGHHPVIGIGKNGVRVFGDASGPPAGILPTCRWKDTETQIGAADTLLLFTDGIVEARAMNTQRAGEDEIEDFGMERLCEALKGHYRSTPRELIERLNQKVMGFCAPVMPHDDCTLIAVKYLG
ncbi:MAG: SpoIIE family protein phosphatase [Candidatus Hydrogenedentes bacterium]|nr:SpoIIE family protein phosphatase [Candidatus Hydrogenedentota bacterium]